MALLNPKTLKGKILFIKNFCNSKFNNLNNLIVRCNNFNGNNNTKDK